MGWAMAAAAGISAGGGILSGLLGSNASKSAGAQSAAAANNATALNSRIYDQTTNALAPYVTQGRHALDTLDSSMGWWASPQNSGLPTNLPTNIPTVPGQINMDQATLERTPGYQFNLAQGLKGVTNSSAARGLASSGAALKGAANYVTGLADSTYQNQYNNAYQQSQAQFGNQQTVFGDQQTQFGDQMNLWNADQTNKTNFVNRLLGLAGIGENAGAQTGSAGATAGANAGNAIMAAGNAQAAGTTGSASALAGGINGVGNSAMNYLMMSKLFGSGGGGGTNADSLAYNAAMNASPGMYGPGFGSSTT